MKRLVVVMLVILVVTACNVSRDNISQSDLCITHISSHQKICYGQTKEEVEKVLGVGETETSLVIYENGLSIYFKENQVALIMLDNGSEAAYKSIINVGDTRGDILAIYGEDNLYAETITNTVYFYDSKNKVFIDIVKAGSDEHGKQVYVVGTRVNNYGYIEQVILGDFEAMRDVMDSEK